MKIELKCKCGATAVFEDSQETEYFSMARLSASDWQEMHEPCLQGPQEPELASDTTDTDQT